jgi:hypothetical protein
MIVLSLAISIGGSLIEAPVSGIANSSISVIVGVIFIGAPIPF